MTGHDPAAVTFLVRLCLVILFLPCGALDKVWNFKGAVKQAQEEFSSLAIARTLIVTGFFVEIFMSIGILTGIADRLAAFILAGYCATTALLFKQFWKPGDFWREQSRGRELFWDFLKNFSLAGGFLLVTFGTTAATVPDFFIDPLSSTHPYAVRGHNVP